MEKKFYLIEIAKGDSKIQGVGAYEYATLNEAIATYHQKMSSAMKSDLFEREQLLVIDSNNVIYKSEIFERPIEVPEEVNEESEV